MHKEDTIEIDDMEELIAIDPSYGRGKEYAL